MGNTTESMNARAYTSIGKFYISCGQRLSVYLWIVLCKYKALGLQSIGFSRKHAVKGLFALVLNRIGVRNCELYLPLAGNICRPVHRGYKIFNFEQGSVGKVFAPDVEQSYVAGEIEAEKTAAELDFSPSLLRYDLESRCYEQEHVSGELAKLSKDAVQGKFLSEHRQEMLDSLKKMVLLREPETCDLKSYLSKLAINFHEEKYIVLEKFKAQRIEIAKFIKTINNKLGAMAEQKTQLVYTHGDFSLVNIICNADGLKVIDWEGANTRSVLNDFYNLFMTELYYGRMDFKEVPKIEEIKIDFAEELSGTLPVFWGALQKYGELYRFLYYLERLYMLLERDLNDNGLKVIQHSLTTFQRYEDAVANSYTR